MKTPPPLLDQAPKQHEGMQSGSVAALSERWGNASPSQPFPTNDLAGDSGVMIEEL